MVRLPALLVLMSAALISNGQDINITFSGTGAATQIDSVTATNISTGESVILPGYATLVLTPKTGINAITENAANGMIFPNPFSGTTTLIAGITESQSVSLKVQNLVGQIVSQTVAFVRPGENAFRLSVSAEGIYWVSLTTNQGTTGFKVICTGSSGSVNQVQYLGSGSNNNYSPLTTHNNLSQTDLKTSQSVYNLGYSSGDIVRYRCRYGNFTATFTDSPLGSKNYKVAFAPIASFSTNPENGTTETLITLDASSCSDAETPADELEVRWDLDGDGVWDTDYDVSKIFLIKFPLGGSYSIGLQVKDDGGLTDSITQTLGITYPTFTDSRDGRIYHYNKIGDQIWMLENLAWLPAVNPPGDGSYAVKKYYVFGYDGTEVNIAKGQENYGTYGVLYNWQAAKDACPSGWHLSSDQEWITMEKRLGMSPEEANSIIDTAYRCSGSVGGKLKETGTDHWANPNVGATNSFGFTALPAGVKGYDGTFVFMGTSAYFWTSDFNGQVSFARALGNNSDGVYRYQYSHFLGFLVRCIRD